MGTMLDDFVQIAEPDATLPYLSHSRVNRYLMCPEQYRRYYVENLRPAVKAASLEFGQAIHQSLARFYQHQESPIKVFLEIWDSWREKELRYSYRESWDKLRERGHALLAQFQLRKQPALSCVEASEQKFELTISNLDVSFVGVIDLMARVDGVVSLIDFKTSSSAYQDHEVELSDQLTAYQLAKPEAHQSVFCVFVKTKEPRIDWYYSRRPPEQLTEYLEKVSQVGRLIQNQVFFKRPGKWCAYCDYLPVCLKRT
jgi:CRISPR/Cas system-associated exonuclease Cas4 (RecB family)